MTRHPVDPVERVWWLVGLAVVAMLAVTDFVSGRQINGAYGVGAVIAAFWCSPRRTLVVAVVASVASVASGVWNDDLGEPVWTVRFLTCLLLCAVALATAHTNQRRRRQVERIQLLAQQVLDALAVELTGARTVTEVADGFVSHAVRVLGAKSAMVLSLDPDDMLRAVTWNGRGGQAADQFQEVALHSDLPGAVAARDGVDLHYRTVQEIETVFPALAGYYPTELSLHVLPLRRGDRTLGLLALTFPPGSFGPAEDGFLHSLAGALASALTRAEELQAADAETQRTALLAEASMTLSRSLDMEGTLAEVVRLLVPRFADWCAVQLLRNGELETIEIQHRDPETTEWARSMRDAFPTRMDAATGAPQVVRTGTSEIYPFIPADLVDAAAVNDEHRAILRRMGFTSAIVAPLKGRDRILGAVTLIHAESGRRYAEADLTFLEEIAERVALALDTAATFEQQSERLAGVTLIAEAAQRAILAPPPPRVGPVVLNARYISAAVEAQVGGDLYELVARPTSVRLLVGDVRGKGLGAVRTATVVLGEFRAAAAGTGDVAEVAREIDRRLVPYLPDIEDFVTGVLVDIDHDGRFSIASCGHPPPVLVTAAGEVRTIDLDHAVPLGLGADPRPTHGRLGPGDSLLLYTDGLIEARSPDGSFVDPTPLLAGLVSDPPETALDNLLASLKAAAGQALDDDLALLLACYDPRP
ncbi:GAF domain-containing SpoIIE family protein phosphatase [Nocardioides sp. SR21]|uniref:GAF domain-containing SpoIIE family protein phosphatase n=1 Tax=Nocardioides sp. SR21 TaxID=2919501 RepID=UPI001FA9C8FF|nr:SpoIIE family protein phosphatase [Nocardioides sp. SR21]